MNNLQASEAFIRQVALVEQSVYEIEDDLRAQDQRLDALEQDMAEVSQQLAAMRQKLEALGIDMSRYDPPIKTALNHPPRWTSSCNRSNRRNRPLKRRYRPLKAP